MTNELKVPDWEQRVVVNYRHNSISYWVMLLLTYWAHSRLVKKKASVKNYPTTFLFLSALNLKGNPPPTGAT